jgi:DNA-binding response OmpR family regulator
MIQDRRRRHSPHTSRTGNTCLRLKLETDPSMPKHLITELGIGYRFVP